MQKQMFQNAKKQQQVNWETRNGLSLQMLQNVFM